MFTRYLLPALAVGAFGFAMVQMTNAQHKPPSAAPPVEPAKSPFGKQVSGAGIVEPETENIAVGTHLPGVVKAVHVRVDDRVSAGALLFELDDRALGAELSVRAAARESAAAQVSKQEALPRREELPPLEAKVAEARATLEDKLALFERTKRENDSGVGARELYDTRRMAVDVAKAQLRGAEAALELSRAGAWKYDLALSKAALAQADAQYAQTRTELDRLRVAAPRVRKPGASRALEPIPPSDLVEFRVLQVNVRPGEFVSAAPNQPLLVLGTVGRLNVRVDIDENDIGRFAPGTKGTAAPRGDPATKYDLTFVRVEPYVIPKKSLTGGNTERVDTRVLQVIYALDRADAPLFVGQQMDVALEATP
jgi:HlyD family secretion protein